MGLSNKAETLDPNSQLLISETLDVITIVKSNQY